jgi:acetylglutamate kinase
MTRVIKLGGRAQHDARLPEILADAIRREPRTCVVHGGGDDVSVLQRKLGRQPRFIGGRRVTTPEDVELVRMVLSGTINKRLVQQLRTAGVRAAGISGEDGGLLTATLFDGGSLGLVGDPSAVDPALVEALLQAGFVPVVSPVAMSVGGGPLNVNGDDAAAALAVALDAAELVLVADVPGVRDQDGAVIRALDGEFALSLVAAGTASGGMAAKLDAACRALVRGVPRVRIGDLTAVANAEAGTTISLTPTPV